MSSPLKLWTTGGALVVVVALLLTILTLGSVDRAEAQAADDRECPDGFALGLAAMPASCARLDPASFADTTCPAPARGTAGDCYVLVDPTLSCLNGQLEGDICKITGDLPDNEPPTCPTHIEGVFLDGFFCYTLTSPQGDGCVLPDVLDPGGLCRTAFPLQAGALFCAQDGFSLINGRCVRFEAAVVSEATCAAPDSFGLCRAATEAREAEPLCDASAAVLVGTDCIVTVMTSSTSSGLLCPNGFLPAGDGAHCIRSFTSSQGPSDCPEGSLGVPDACFIIVPKTDDPQSPCPNGSYEFEGLCRKGVANAAGRFSCPNPHASLSGRLCAIVVEGHSVGPCDVDCDPALTCPVDFVVESPFVCEAIEPAVQSDLACPRLVLGSSGTCFVYEAPMPVGGSCAEGSLQGAMCFITSPPVTTEQSCPVSATVFFDGVECYFLIYGVEQADGSRICVAPDRPDPSGFCRADVPFTTVAATCEVAFTVVNGRCGRLDLPSGASLSCTHRVAADERCIRDVADAEGRFYCENPDSMLQGDQCLTVEGFLVQGGYVAVSPERLLDTRNSSEGAYDTPWGPGQTRSVQVTGVGGVPSSEVESVALNITTVNPTAAISWLDIVGGGAGTSDTAVHNFGTADLTSEIVNDLVIVTPNLAGSIDITNEAGTTDLVIDVVGYFQKTGGVGYTPVSPDRILDTRNATEGPFSTPWAEGQVRELTVVGVGGVPDVAAQAVALHITSVNPTAAASWLTVWPVGESAPTTAAHNFGTDAATTEIVDDLVIAKVGANGAINIANAVGSVDLVIDVVGYFYDPTGAGYVGMNPTRVLDTRNGTDGDYNTPWGPGETRSIAVTSCSAPQSVAVHITTVSPSDGFSWLTVGAAGEAQSTTAVHTFGTAPFATQIANDLVFVEVTPTGGNRYEFDVTNASGDVDLVVDLVGITTTNRADC